MSRIITNTILILLCGLCFGCRTSVPTMEDGGVVRHNTGTDSPKVISSTEIKSFKGEFSLATMVFEEENELEGNVYQMSAVWDRDTVKANIKWYDRYGGGENRAFETDRSFLIKLQDIVAKYDLAQYNGYYYEVAGLPDRYGASIVIDYVSGEQIYAFDNQSCFLPVDAMEELLHLFLLSGDDL